MIYKYLLSRIFKHDQKNKTSTEVDRPPDLALLPPPPVWSRILIWTLGSGTTFLIIWSFVVKVDERVIFSGEITTSSPEVIVSIQDPGVIKQIATRPHQAIERGDIILVYDDDQTQLKLANIKQKRKLLELRRKSDFNLYSLRKTQIQQQVELDIDLLERMEFLLASGAIEKTQILRQRSQVAKGRIQQSSLEEERQRIEYEVQQSLEDLLTTEEELKARASSFTVRSPVAGFVQQMRYQTVGERILGGEVIATIIPKRDLIARVSIPSKLQAPVEINSKATVSVDAYPAGDYGSINAVVRSLSPMTIDENKNQSSDKKLYNADLTLLNPTNPELLQTDDLRPGMFVTAQMVLRDKPVITTIFNVLEKVFDPLTEQR